MKHTAFLPLLLLTTSCSSVFTRATSDQVVGGPVYPGVVADADLIDFAWNGPYLNPVERVMGTSIGVLSAPFDILFDTLMLPADVIAWSNGVEFESLKDAKTRRREARTRERGAEGPEGGKGR